MAKIQVVVLERQQKEQLEAMLRKGRWSPREIKRAQILLMANDNKEISNGKIAESLGLTRDTVRIIKQRFITEGIEAAIFDRPRPGQPKKLSSRDEAFIIATACSDAPKGYDHWTLELLKKELRNKRGAQVSIELIRTLLIKNKVKPWRKKMWCVPEVTPEFEEKMMDVLSVYERDYDEDHPVICLDEKNHQLLSTPRGERPAAPGKPRRVDYEYRRHGTVNHFVAVEPKAGRRHIRVSERRTKADFASFIRFIMMRVYPRAKKVAIVLDNLNTHTDAAIMQFLGEEEGRKIVERIEWHFTPTHASWLNMAEIEISILSRQVLGKRIADVEVLKQEVRTYQGRRNIAEAKISWGFTQEQAKKVFDLHRN